MLLLYYTQSLLFWLGLPNFKSNDEITTIIQTIDYEHLPIEVCMAQCVKDRRMSGGGAAQMSSASTTIKSELFGNVEYSNNKQMLLEICRDNCTTLNNNTTQETINNGGSVSTIKQIHENYSLNLICRDESTLHFLIDLHGINKGVTNIKTETETDISTSSYAKSSSSSSSTKLSSSAFASSQILENIQTNGNDYATLFVIKIHLASDADKYFVYLSDDNFFTIDNLLNNTTYNISVMAVHSNNRYSVIAQQQQFDTLRRSYNPGNVTEIKITNFTENPTNKMYLSATMTWKPPADMTCHYDIICYSPEREDYDLPPLEIRDPRQLYKFQLENLTFSSKYNVGIRAINSKHMKESNLLWNTFKAPSCVEWHNYNFNICAPDAPQNLHVEQTYVEPNYHSLNITWQLPTYLPDYYTIRIHDLSEQGQSQIYNLTKEIHNIFIPKFAIYGLLYEVILTAYTRGGQTSSYFTEFTKTIIHLPEKNPFVKLIAIILAPIFCVAMLSLTLFIIYHRRAKLKRYQDRCKYFEELEKKAPIYPKDNFDLNTNNKSIELLQYQLDVEDMSLFNDEMEIDRSQLTLHEILGEGAFGLVKRGIYTDIKLGSAHEVAVKMLKDHPSIDDVRAFRREIDVMKSVEKHPNIVGILGHCTHYGSEMMLLTEYCSFGNLLNFLRDEWHYLHELQQTKPTLTMNIRNVETYQHHSKHTTTLPKTHNNGKSMFTIDGTFQNIKDNQGNMDIITSSNGLKTQEEVIGRFKKKYNEFNVTTATAARIEAKSDDEEEEEEEHVVSNYCIDNNNSITLEENLQRLEDLNKSTTATATTTILTPTTATYHHNHHQQHTTIMIQDGTNQDVTKSITATSISTTSKISPATENKSYGYNNSCCTNSCKCDVNVIIKNIDSSESSKENEELDLLLRQQQQQQQQHQQPDEHIQQQFKHTCNIEIRNCNCSKMQRQQCDKSKSKLKPQSEQPTTNSKLTINKRQSSTSPGAAVENKTYFKIFNSDKLVTRKLKPPQIPPSASSTSSSHRAGKVKKKSKPSSLTLTAPPQPPPPLSATFSIDEKLAEKCNRVPLSSGDLLYIARQVAVGMEFLAKNKVVHRDLAARNVLVAPDRTVKIADFGLSRDVYQENMYKKTGNGKLPIKWLALESLTHQMYTTQSDVWSYGILLYEIVTLGATPYPSIPTNRLLHLLKTGYRMEKPKNCGQEFYNLMYSCWNSVPNERPTFNGIIKTLDDLLGNLNSSSATTNTATFTSIGSDFIKDCTDLSKQESPIQQICSDDSYLKPL